MREQFRGFFGYDENEVKKLWEEAIFVVDTNILLNFYKYTSEKSTQSLLGILKDLKSSNRLWIPYQVALEYFFNYEGNMSKQHEGFEVVGEKLMQLKEDAEKILRTVKSDHPYIDTDKFNFYINEINNSNDLLQKKVDEEIKLLPDSHLIRDELLNLLDGIIGESYAQKDIDNIEKEGKIRYAKLIPPGFEDLKDKKKAEYRTYGQINYQQYYGDLILWKQIIDNTNKMNPKVPVIFITEDRKKDWWELDDHKNIKRPHPHLIQEFINETKQNFYMYRTKRFVQLAQKYLDTGITDEQVQDVSNEVENIRKVEELIERDSYGLDLSEWEELRISEYLPFQSRQHFQKLNFESSYTFDKFQNIILEEELKGYLEKVLPEIKGEFWFLLDELAKYSVKTANYFVDQYNNLPSSTTSINQIRKLFELIDAIRIELQIIEEMENNQSWAKEYDYKDEE